MIKKFSFERSTNCSFELLLLLFQLNARISSYLTREFSALWFWQMKFSDWSEWTKNHIIKWRKLNKIFSFGTIFLFSDLIVNNSSHSEITIISFALFRFVHAQQELNNRENRLVVRHWMMPMMINSTRLEGKTIYFHQMQWINWSALRAQTHEGWTFL